MSKTPEEMAREYADDWHKDCDYPEPLLSTARKATQKIFLAGYRIGRLMTTQELERAQMMLAWSPEPISIFHIVTVVAALTVGIVIGKL